MRLLGLDLETTGLDTANDRIIELGAVLWETDTKRPLVTIGVFLYDKTYPKLLPVITELTGIDQSMLDEFGTDPKKNFEWLEGFVSKHHPDYIVAHNGENFDKPLFLAELRRNNVDAPNLTTIPWIDTKADLPHTKEPGSNQLKHLAMDAGFVNPFAHRAVFDVLTMLRVLSDHDIQKVIECSKIPFVVVRAIVSYDDRQLAKDHRFMWENIGDMKYPKMWVKRIKEDKLEQLRKDCSFKVVQLGVKNG